MRTFRLMLILATAAIVSSLWWSAARWRHRGRENDPGRRHRRGRRAATRTANAPRRCAGVDDGKTADARRGGRCPDHPHRHHRPRSEDVPAAVRAARDGILAMGGYVGASNAGTNGDTPYADIAYRVPAERWEDALAELRAWVG